MQRKVQQYMRVHAGIHRYTWVYTQHLQIQHTGMGNHNMYLHVHVALDFLLHGTVVSLVCQISLREIFGYQHSICYVDIVEPVYKGHPEKWP